MHFCIFGDKIQISYMRTPTLQYLYLQKPISMILFICIISVLPWLDLSDLSQPDTSETAAIATAMLESGDWVMPPLADGQIVHEHPMLYWLVSLGSMWQGYVSHLTVYLPGALAFIVIVTCTLIFFGRRIKFHEAFIASLFLVTCTGMQSIFLINSGDLLFATFIILSLIRLYRWEEKMELKGLPIEVSLLLSCAILTRGLMGVILPLLAFGIYLFLLKKYDKLTLCRTLLYIGVSALFIPALWYITVWKQGGTDLLLDTLGTEFYYFWNTDNGGAHNCFYVLALLGLGFMPWIVFLAFSLFGMEYRKPELPRSGVKFFSLVVFVVLLIAYAVMPVKRSSFLLPLYPFITIFLAEYALYVTEYRTLCTRFFAGFLSTIVLLGLIFPVLPPEWNGGFMVEFNTRMALVFGFASVMLAVVYYQMLKRINIKILYATIALTYSVNLLLNVLF